MWLGTYILRYLYPLAFLFSENTNANKYMLI